MDEIKKEGEHTDSSKKYIRTFAGDMKVLQEGGTPNLEPFSKSPTVESQTVPAYSEEQASEPRLDPLKTYKGDFSDRMKETDASTSSILAAEQDAPRVTVPMLEKSQRSGRVLIIAGILLLLVGAIGSSFAYLEYKRAHEPVAVVPSVSSPIFVDERALVSGRGQTLMDAIAQSVSKSIPGGDVRLLHFSAETSSTTESVFSALDLPAPSVLLRNIDPTKSMAGIVRARAVQSPFFILSVTSYSPTFSGMLSWEKTMPRDLVRLFTPHERGTIEDGAQVSIASSTPAVGTTTVQRAFQPSFTDEIVSNHDVRVYRDDEGRSVFLYGYWNLTTLVIARDPDAFREIIVRLGTSRTSQN